jgi:hypothetical protein
MSTAAGPEINFSNQIPAGNHPSEEIPHFGAGSLRSSSGRKIMQLLHIEHQSICQRHKRPSQDSGQLS